MVTKVYIKDNTKCPVHYLPDLPNFKNGTTYEFQPGVNIIVGENGSGKTTLLNIIRRYMMVGESECDRGIYNCNISKMYGHHNGLATTLLDGVDVYGDYDKNIFRLCHATEKSSDETMKSFESFGATFLQMHSSTGEGVNIALNALFEYIFSSKVKLKFDYRDQFRELWPSYIDYCDAHRLSKEECPDEWTLLLDEPDRNLDIQNINQVMSVLTFHKEQTQVIAVVHNPLIIYSLSQKSESPINWIELTPGYVEKVRGIVNSLIQK